MHFGNSRGSLFVFHISPKVGSCVNRKKGMSYYIDTENTDMQQLAFDKIKGNDLPVWRDVKSPKEIVVTRISGAILLSFP